MIKRLKGNRYHEVNDTGFGAQTQQQGARSINADGSFNVVQEGLPFFKRLNIFHYLITIPWYRFNLLVFAAYLVVNTFFASVYLTVGMDQIDGDLGQTGMEKFWDAFFFSAQTLTTVGYGRQNPLGLTANFVSALECLVGLMSFALMTGLLYSRFSRPVVNLIYSKNLLLAPYQQGTALMFRIANTKKNHLIDCEVEVLLAMDVADGDKTQRRFFNLDLERKKIQSLMLSWTIVHPITNQSPLHELSTQDLIDCDAEFLFFFKAFDDTYSQNVHTRHSYKPNQLVENVKFSPMFYPSLNGRNTILRLNEIDNYFKP